MKNSLKIIAAALSAITVMSCAGVSAATDITEEYKSNDNYYSTVEISDLKKFVKLYKKDIQKAVNYYHKNGLNPDDGASHRFFSYDELEIFKNADDYGIVIHAKTIDEEPAIEKTFSFTFFTDEGYYYRTPEYDDNAVKALSVKQIIKDSGIPDSSMIAAAEFWYSGWDIEYVWAELVKIKNGWLKRYDGEDIPTSSGSAFCQLTHGFFKPCAYYIRKDGKLQTRNRVIDGVLYVFKPDGTCERTYTGWTKSKAGRKYYINGVCLTGWQIINGKYYHFGDNGIAAVGKIKIGGCTYYFDEKGAWTGKRSKTGKKPSDFSVTFSSYAYNYDGKTINRLFGYDYEKSENTYTSAELKLPAMAKQIIWSMICEGSLLEADTKTFYDESYILRTAQEKNYPIYGVSSSDPSLKHTLKITADGKDYEFKLDSDLGDNPEIWEYEPYLKSMWLVSEFISRYVVNSEAYKSLPPMDESLMLD